MYEKLVENWLISVNEIGYQLPFCEALLAEGFTIIHISRHGRGEHGKDVVARRADGVLCTFQLKGEEITLPEWRKIRGEVEELVQLPVRHPGVSEEERYIPHLVTNGEIQGDAIENIKRYEEEWVNKGFPRLVVWSHGNLHRLFLDAHGSFFPTGLIEFRNFVDLYAGPFDGPLPKEKFANLLEPLTGEKTAGLTEIKLRRALAALTLLASYIIEQYERAGNYLAAVEGWTMVGASILRVAEREELRELDYKASLEIVRIGYDRNLGAFASEVMRSENFGVARYGLVDPILYGVRTALIVGWLATWALDCRWYRNEEIDVQALFKLFRRESSAIRWVTEADWPFRLAIVFLLEREGNASEAEQIVFAWISLILKANGRNGPGLPSPYWPQEKVMRKRYGLLAPSEDEDFHGRSYTLAQSLDMMVRRLRRQSVAAHWPEASRVEFCDFVPDRTADYFTWQTNDGVLHTSMPQLAMSWGAWRESAATFQVSIIPRVLVRHSEWILPFLLTYPHRANRAMTGLADAVIGRRSLLSN